MQRTVENKLQSLIQENIDLKFTVNSFNQELLSRNAQVYKLREILEKLSWTEEAFQNNKKKLMYFTGMQKNTFFPLLIFMKPEISKISTILTEFQVLLLTLMKLKNDIPFQELAYRFLIEKRTASAIFQRTIFLMFSKLQCLVEWPSRERLEQSVPSCLSSVFGKNVIIMMCNLEITLKQLYLKKYTIGIVPYGRVSFISDGFDGNCSNEQMVERCGIFNLLMPGDVVVNDRKCKIVQNLDVQNATIANEQQRNDDVKIEEIKYELLKSVETFSEEIKKKFRILNGPVDLTLSNVCQVEKNLLDCILFVCCALHNLPWIKSESKY